MALTTVPASPDVCFEVAIDLERYPEWAEGITTVTVHERDSDGRPIQARFEAQGIGRGSNYTLAYDLSEAPSRMSWTMIEGDLTSRLEGTYVFEPSTVGPAETDVTFELFVDLAVPLPGFVKRRAEDKILDAALARFRARVITIAA